MTSSRPVALAGFLRNVSERECLMGCRPLDAAVFLNPPAEYRGAPFWSWNAKLDRDQLFRQVDYFREMGMGGFHIHPRTGLDTEYLGEEYLEMVRACVDKAQSLGLLVWLYDEDRWPSGYGGGLVTKDPRNRGMRLRFAQGLREENENRQLLARYEVVLNNGCLAHYRRLAESESASDCATIWYAYSENVQTRAWYNHQTYVDTLSKSAIERFIETTHEAYARAVGEQFGKTIPAIFTDEPQFSRETYSLSGPDLRDAYIPFTRDLLTTYEAAFEQKLEDVLPELFWELPGSQASVARYRYHDHVSERFAAAFADTLGEWCQQHGLALTGHLSQEGSLVSQTLEIGEAMRSYRGFQLPGIDMLGDNREYNTAKQAQSACHQYGRSGVLSELYGVTGWHFDFTGHKGQGDWQAALGVTVRVHHLTWFSMAGEAKRDYPASIGYQSPWYREYRIVEDHFARLNTVLTRGRPGVRVGMIHPIESLWLCYGRMGKPTLECEERDKRFEELTQWLLFGLIDFDFICESLLPSQSPVQRREVFCVGKMAYDAVMVPSLRTMRSTTLERLEHFAEAGGRVIFVGEIPSLVDALPSDRAERFAEKCERIACTRSQILTALENQRDVAVRLSGGQPAADLLHQIRVEGEKRSVFLCNTDRKKALEGTEIRFRGSWRVTHWDTLAGTHKRLVSRLEDGWTALNWDFPACGSLLLSLEPGWSPGGHVCAPLQTGETTILLSDPLPVTLSEPNVLVLDQAEWRVNQDDWQPAEEILRLDNLVRCALNLPIRTGEGAQPWADTGPAPTLGEVKLRFTITSEVMVRKPRVGLENASSARLFFDGVEIDATPTGWWTDEAIGTIPLPDIDPGQHELVVAISFNRRTELEACYLLGDFGVTILGRRAQITAPVRTLAFGDWTRQGLPFYAGNVTYHCLWTAEGGQWRLKIPRFNGAVISVALDKEKIGAIAFPPFEIELGRVMQGDHSLAITVYGNRANAFGPLHNCKEAPYGAFAEVHPGAYRTTGEFWSYEYQVMPMGLLTAPMLTRS